MIDQHLRAGGDGMRLRWMAAWAFRVYFLALLAGVLALGASWYAGEIADYAALIGALWYGIAGLGTVVLGLLLAVRIVAD